MWQPTHVQVTVQKARGLLYKGKHETNDCFVVISLGKDKFQTSIKEKASSPVEWREECELSIPSHGNTAALGLTVFHRNALGLDEFLGQIQVPLSEFDVYERPRSRWYRLKGKPEKDKKKGEKERGEIEAKVAFTVKSGSLSDVSKKDIKKAGSITSLKNLGGSLMSLGSKEKQSIKSFAKSVSHKIDKIAKPSRKKSGRKSSRDSQGFPEELQRSRQHAGDADPGVISDSDEDFGFDEEVTLRSSGSPYSTVSRGSSLAQEHQGIIEEHGTNLSVFPNEHKPPPKPLRIGEVAEVSSPEPGQDSPITPHRRSSTTSTTQVTQPSPLPPLSNTLTFNNLTPINPQLSSTTSPLNSYNNSTTSTRGGSVTPPTASSPDSALAPSETGSGAGFKDSGSHSSQDEDDILPPIMVRRNSSRRGIHRSPVKDIPKMAPPRPEPPKTSVDEVETAFKSNEYSTLASTAPIVTIDSSEAPPTSPPAIPTIFIKEATPEPCYKVDSSPDLSEPSHRKNSTPPARPPVPKSVTAKTVPQSSPEPAPRTVSAPKAEPNSPPANEQVFQPTNEPVLPQAVTAKTKIIESQPSGNEEIFPFDERPPSPTTPTYTNSTPITPTSAPPYNPFHNSSNNNNHSSSTPNTNTTPTSTRGSSIASTPPRVSNVGYASGGIAARPSAAVTRSGSLHEKPTSPASSPFTSQSPPTDEWERKLYGRNHAMVGSVENVGRSDSRSSLNTSRSSSTLDITKDDASRFPEIKPLKLGKKSHEDGDESDGKKRKGKGDGLKNKLFGSRSNLAEEDSRFVEGGNDRLPNPPQRHSRLPQEIHDKFAGKSREDLMELIVTLQSTVDKQARHARDLEDYIDDLLLRVMEQTPQILQAPVTPSKKMKVFGAH